MLWHVTVKIMKRTTKAMSSREIMAQVMTKICDMDKAQLGKVYDFIVDTFENGDYEQVQEPVAEYKAPKKDEEHYVVVNGVKLKQTSQKEDGFDRSLYEAHARAMGLFLAGKGRKGNGKVSSKDRMRVYQSMWYDYDPTYKMHK